MKIGVYCGSFAPVHLGHIGIVKETLKEKYADKVIIVPSNDYWNKKVAYDINTRLKCLKFYESEDIIIDDDMDDINTKYTYDLLLRLKDKYPEDELCLMLGADNMVNFDKWYKSEELLKDYEFIIMNRDDINVLAHLERLDKKTYKILNCDNFNVSSTYIRENLNNFSLLEGLVDKEIVEILKA